MRKSATSKYFFLFCYFIYLFYFIYFIYLFFFLHLEGEVVSLQSCKAEIHDFEKMSIFATAFLTSSLTL